MSKILIVEDDKVLNSAYLMILERDNHDVISVFDGAEALENVSDYKPDIILLDLLMPNVSGIQFLEKYNPSEHPNTKVIVLSNMGDEKLVEQAKELGAYKYIIKAHTTPSQLSLLVKRTAEESQTN